jgi:hypothetical protein
LESSDEAGFTEDLGKSIVKAKVFKRKRGKVIKYSN